MVRWVDEMVRKGNGGLSAGLGLAAPLAGIALAVKKGWIKEK